MRKSKTRPGIIFLIVFFICGCLSIKPTYTKEKIVESITTLCQQEYNIEPRVWLLAETVWIYMPMPCLITKEIKWDEETIEKINKVMLGTSRVLLSMKPRPQFLVFVASDIKEYGIDYSIITWIPDIVKFQLQLISRDEFGRRRVVKIEENSQALFDTQGDHIEKKQIHLGDFLAEQIAQRIQTKFTLDLKTKDYFKVEKIYGTFQNENFRIYAQIKQIKPLPKIQFNIQQEIMKIIAYVIRAYEFKDFLLVEVENPATGEKSVFSRLALKELFR